MQSEVTSASLFSEDHTSKAPGDESSDVIATASGPRQTHGANLDLTSSEAAVYAAVSSIFSPDQIASYDTNPMRPPHILSLVNLSVAAL